MPIPRDFLQTPSGDVDFSLGLRPTPDLLTFAKQQISQTLNSFQGDWMLDTRLGIPLHRDVIARRPDPNLRRDLYRRALTLTRGVGSVDTLAVAYDGRTRKATVEGQARVVSGDVIPVAADFVVGR